MTTKQRKTCILDYITVTGCVRVRRARGSERVATEHYEPERVHIITSTTLRCKQHTASLRL